MVLQNDLASGNVNWNFRVGNGSIDTGSNYSDRHSTNGGADTTSINANRIGDVLGNQPNDRFGVMYFANLASKEKLMQGHIMDYGVAGAGATTAPDRVEIVAKWTNTSNVIDTVQLLDDGTDVMAAGSELVVLGWDPADTHTNNFWEELASNQLGSETTLSSGTFTAKKYLWVQIYTANVASDNQAIYFNSDNSTNYSFRYSNNGGSDGTVTSNNTIQTAIAGGSGTYWSFTNMFIINNSSNEKLVIIHTNENTTEGASNAPVRTEVVGKWANTSSQITDIKIADGGGTQNNQQVGSFIKVWGAD